jgi:hypothetical protein
MINVVLLTVVTIFVLWRFRRGVGDGMVATVFFMVLLPTELRLPTGSALPEITVHRVLLILASVFVLTNTDAEDRPPSIPAMGLFGLVTLSRFLSTLAAESFLPSLKELLGFALESWLFYVVACRGLRDGDTIYRVLRSALMASVLVGCLATVEKYRGVNLAAQIIPGMADSWNSVTATYRHRIMFGYAMAMAFPLAFALRERIQGRWDKIAVWSGMLILPAAAYFSNSRGPWVGAAIAAVAVAVAGGRRIRKPMLVLAVLASIVMIAKPGVLETIGNRWEQTQSTDTLKGRSASYRLELWRVAFSEIRGSVTTLALGYGGGSAEQMQLGQEFEFGGGSGKIGHTSWDSEFAVNFLKYGFLGLLADTFFYAGLLLLLLRSWRDSPREQKQLHVAALSTLIVFVWAMTNVAIFNPQLTYLLWTMLAISVRANQVEWKNEEARMDGVPDTSDEDVPGVKATI